MKIFGKYFHFSDFENLKKIKNRKFSKFFKNLILENENISRKFSKFLKIFFCYFCSRSCETCILSTATNLPRWIPHYGDDISRIRISTSADFHAYWSIFGPKPAFVQYSVKRTEAPGQPRDQIFHEKSSQSCRSPSLTMGNCVTDLLTHFHGRWSRADRLGSRFTFKNQHFWSKTSFCTVWGWSRVGPDPPCSDKPKN